MNISNCIFINSLDDEIKTLKVTYEDNKVEIITLNLDDPKVSEIVKMSGGIEAIESNTRKYNIWMEKEDALYKKFKKHMEISDDLSFMFLKEFDQETLFNVKIMLFELPEVENCNDRELKKKLRTANNLIDIIGIYYLMKNTN